MPYLVNRLGKAPSHTDAAVWIDGAPNLVVPNAPRVCLRDDTDFSLTAHFDRRAEWADFIFLERKEKLSPLTEQTRRRQPNEKQRIARERGY